MTAEKELLNVLANTFEQLKDHPDLRVRLRGLHAELFDLLTVEHRPELGASPHEKSLARHRNRANKYSGLYDQAKREIALMQIKIVALQAELDTARGVNA